MKTFSQRVAVQRSLARAAQKKSAGDFSMGEILFAVAETARRSAPTGLRPPAQGCEARATLGNGIQNGPNPNGVASLPQRAIRRNPVGVGFNLKTPTQGSPLGAGNPGLEAAAPLGLNDSRQPHSLPISSVAMRLERRVSRDLGRTYAASASFAGCSAASLRGEPKMNGGTVAVGRSHREPRETRRSGCGVTPSPVWTPRQLKPGLPTKNSRPQIIFPTVEP